MLLTPITHAKSLGYNATYGSLERHLAEHSRMLVMWGRPRKKYRYKGHLIASLFICSKMICTCIQYKEVENMINLTSSRAELFAVAG